MGRVNSTGTGGHGNMRGHKNGRENSAGVGLQDVSDIFIYFFNTVRFQGHQEGNVPSHSCNM